MVAYFVYGFAMFAAWPSMKTEFMKYPNVYRPKDEMMNDDDHDGDEDCDHAVGHHFHHLVLGTIDVGVLHEFSFHGWPCSEHGEAIDRVGDHSPEGGQCNAGVVHTHSC